MSRQTLRPELLPIIPARMARLPIDERGYCVPWFVEWIDGKPDFRVMDRRKHALAIKHRLCWLCGERVGAPMDMTPMVFVIGPMCLFNSLTSEPGSHAECARFAVKACPFMLHPRAKYRTANQPEDAQPTAGMLTHNPGASALYATRKVKPFRVGDSMLLRLGEPVWVEWWAEGKPATRAQVVDAIERGLPFLHSRAAAEGPLAVVELARMVEARAHLLPPETGASV